MISALSLPALAIRRQVTRTWRVLQTGVTEEFIYKRDVDWLLESDFVIAEVTQPSLGVGYELGFAEAKGKPVLCLCVRHRCLTVLPGLSS